MPSLRRPQDAPGMAAFRRGDRGGQAEAFHLDLDGTLYAEDRARPAGMQAAGLYAWDGHMSMEDGGRARRPLPLPEELGELGLLEGYMLTVFPHKGDGDGFFMARMQKKA